MTDTQDSNADEIFRRLEKVPPKERASFIDEHCLTEAVRDQVLDKLGALDADLGDLFTAPTIHRRQLERSDRRTIGPYRLLQEIGEGGFGIVYMAEQESPVRRSVALKILKPGMDSREIIARFEAERQALAMMSHPNIATVLDVGTTDEGHPYFVMELVKGIPIIDFCDKSNLSPRERLKLACEVCHAVEHAHQKGIIHRDIKPSNILVTLHGETPVPKVIDFGVAKALHQPLTEKTLFTRYGQMVGTPAYMSPEQADLSGLDVDTRSDVYSLGVLLYELLTGTTPLEAERLHSVSYVEIQRIICEEEPPTPSTRVSLLGRGLASIATRRRTDSSRLRQLLRGELDWIVMRALEKDRTRRYQSPSALAADIDRFLRNEPVDACPPTMRYRLAKFASKHRAALCVVAAILIILTATTTVSVWQALVARDERDRTLVLAGRLDESLAKARGLAELAAANARDASEKARIAKDNAEAANRLRQEAEGAREQLREQLYVSHMNRIGPEYAAGNINVVTRLLDAHRPEPGQTDLRGFEWYYWWRAIHRDLRTVYRIGWKRQGPSYSLAVSPDERWVAIPFHANLVQIVDVASRRSVRMLSTGSDPRNASFSPDGTLLAVGAGEQIVLFDVKSDWTRIRALPLSGGWQEAQLIFSPSGRTLASAMPEGGEITLWDTDTWSPGVYAIEGFALGSNLAFSPDERLLAFGSSREEFRVVLWDVASRKVRKSVRAHQRRVASVAWSSDGSLLATGSADGTVRLWNDALDLTTTLEAGATVSELAFSPDSSYLAAAVREANSVLVWRMDSRRAIATLRGHGHPVTGLAFVGNETLWTVSADTFTKIWDVLRAGPVETIPLGPSQRNLVQPIRSDLGDWRSSSFLGVASISDRRVLLAHEPGKRIESWSLVGGNPQALWEDDKTYAVASLSHGGRYLVTGAPDGRLQTWDCAERKRIADEALQPAVLESVLEAMISRDGQIVAIAKRAGSGVEMVVLDRRRGTRRRFQPNASEVAGTVMSPDGEYLAVRQLFVVQVWDLGGVEPTLVSQISHTPSRSVAFSGDGRRIAVGCWDNNIFVHDVVTGEERLRLEGHVGQVTALAFSWDDGFLVSGSVDKTVRLWNLRSGKLVSTLTGHDGMVDHVDWAPDNLSLLSTSTEDGSIKVWRRATAAAAEQNVLGLAALARSHVDNTDWPALVALLDTAVDIAPDASPDDAELRLVRAVTLADLLGTGLDALADYGAAAESLIADEELLSGALRWINLRPLAASSRARKLQWRYTMKRPEDEEAWKRPGFHDVGWQVGEGPFGTDGKHTRWRTSDIWLRHEFDLDEAVETPLVIFTTVDDEAEFFVNGEPAGRANFLFDRYYHNYQRIDSTTKPGVLKPGRNVLAVHCHNRGQDARIDVGLYTTGATRQSDDFVSRLVAASGGSSRALELRARISANRGDWKRAFADQKRLRAIERGEEADAPGGVRELLPAGSTWRYLDRGQPGPSWPAPDYHDGDWDEGPAPLGYGDLVATVVDFGPDPADKRVTTYFRQTFNVAAPDEYSALRLYLRCDDGAAVYLNGLEVVRDGLPEAADHKTFSHRTVGGEDELRYSRFDVRPEHLRAGSNSLAAEVHQVNSTSSDLSFDLVLEGVVGEAERQK